MRPGEHTFVSCRDPGPVLDARRRGLSVRDTVLVGMPGEIRLKVLVRTPLEGTVASNVVHHGVGALDVDSCRIAVTGGDAEAMQRCNTPGSGRFKPGPTGYGTFDRSSPSPMLDTSRGRWPTNLVFVHSAKCRCDGPASEGDTETVQTWDCDPSCLIGALDVMSGALKSGTGAFKRSSASGYRPLALGAESRPEGTEMITYGDMGCASRFYPQFTNTPEAEAWLARLLGAR